MKKLINSLVVLSFIICYSGCKSPSSLHPDLQYAEGEELNIKANGFKGIWYMNQPQDDEYVYKYSGGLGTYCAKHQPFGVYAEEVNKTFFCFGGSDENNSTLFHNVSYFDHKTGEVANPTIILDKKTTDAHDNPIITMDDKGYIWIFSTSHGTARPSYIMRSTSPYEIDEFKTVPATEIVDGERKPLDNFSYGQIWYINDYGFFLMNTRYIDGDRVIGFSKSKDGVEWNEFTIIAHIEKGHYQVSGEFNGKISAAFNYHPEPRGLNWRTNLYYIETHDLGESWETASGEKVNLPLTEPVNPALIKDTKGELVYLRDLHFDEEGNPIVLINSSQGYASGPQNDPRYLQLFHYDEDQWNNHIVSPTDNNYDMGSIYIEPNGIWRIIANTEPGPQPYNTGGELVIWTSNDKGRSWERVKQITGNSRFNHHFPRRPVNAHPDFYAVWADGHGRQPSESRIYFCSRDGNVFALPYETTAEMIIPSSLAYEQ